MPRASGSLAPEDLGLGRLFWLVREAVIVANLDTRQIVLWSPSAERLFGYAAEEIVGQPIECLVPERLHGRLGTALAALARGRGWGIAGASGPVEVPALSQRGQEIPVEVTLSAIEGESALGRFVLMAARDISYRERIETEHRQVLLEKGARTEAEASQARLAVSAQALDRALAEAELLNTITTLASGEDDPARMLDVTCQHLRRVVALTGASLAVVEGDDLVVRAAVGPFTAEALGQRLARGTGRTWTVVDTGQPLLVNDLQAECLKPTPIRSYLAVPLVWRGAAFGVFEVDSTAPNAFSSDDLALLQKVARTLSGLFELARRYATEVRAVEAAERTRAQLSFLNEASKTLAGSLDYEDTLQSVVRLAVPTLADYCTLDLLHDGGRIWRMAVGHADPAKEQRLRQLRREHPVDAMGPHPVAAVLRTGEAVVVGDMSAADQEAIAAGDEHLDLLRSSGFKSSMTVPLVARGRSLGGMMFVSMARDRYSLDELALAEDLASRCAVAIDNARLYREAQEAVRARDEFLSVAAHELRTPITTLRASAQLTSRQIEGALELNFDRLRHRLRMIDQQSARLSRLVSHLLDISRIEAGRLLLEVEPVDVVRLVHDAAQAAQARTTRHQIRVRTPTITMVLADPLRLEQVVTNLLDNAVKYSPEGGEIDVELRPERRGAIWIAVRDHGTGIPPDKRARIFDRFYQAHSSSHASGMGLGLYISRQIVELHGGRLDVEFPEDGGTRFVLALPVAGAPELPRQTEPPG